MKLLRRNTFDLLWQLIKTNFKMRYNNSLLGVLWVLIKPYSTFLVMYVVWSKLGRGGVENYALYLLTGIVFYTYFNELIVFGQMSLLERAGVILKVNFPRQIAVVSSLFNAVINLLINTFFIIIIAFVLKININPLGLVYLLFLAIIIFLFCLGVSFFFSIYTIRLRDLRNILELGLFLAYWATPIFYVMDQNLVDSTTARVIAANPLGIIINQARAALNIYGEVDITLMMLYFFVSLLIVIVGWSFFNTKVKKIAEYF